MLHTLMLPVLTHSYTLINRSRRCQAATLIHVVEASLKNEVNEDVSQEIDRILAESVPPEAAKRLRELMALKDCRSPPASQGAAQGAAEGGAVDDDEGGGTQPVKKRRADGTDAPPAFAEFGKVKDPVEQLAQIVQMVEWSKGRGSSSYTNAFRVALSQSYSPIVTCLSSHFEGDVDAFIDQHKNDKNKLVVSKFGKKSCCGEGDKCGGTV
jgi:hypothetical protein